MRNFCKHNLSTIVTYNINNSEYVADVDSAAVMRADKALASALEISFSQLSAARCLYISANGDIDGEYYSHLGLTPSELEVLFEYYAFVVSIDTDLGLLDGKESETFFYANLNTGSSLVWTHVVV